MVGLKREIAQAPHKRTHGATERAYNTFVLLKTMPPSALAISNAPPVYASVEALRAAANFGEFGGRFIPETLVAAHEELERTYVACTQDPAFAAELERLGRDYIGRPTPLYFAQRLSAEAGGAQIWLKREELAFTGSHKCVRGGSLLGFLLVLTSSPSFRINNAIGQALVAKRIGKPRVIAETGAGQHGVATATACALLGEGGGGRLRLYELLSHCFMVLQISSVLCTWAQKTLSGSRSMCFV